MYFQEITVINEIWIEPIITVSTRHTSSNNVSDSMTYNEDIGSGDNIVNDNTGNDATKNNMRLMNHMQLDTRGLLILTRVII